MQHRHRDGGAAAVIVQYAAAQVAIHAGALAVAADRVAGIIQAAPLHGGDVVKARQTGGTVIYRAADADFNTAAIADIDIGASYAAQLVADQFKVGAVVVGGALIADRLQHQAAELGWQAVEKADIKGVKVAIAAAIAQGDDVLDAVPLVHTTGIAVERLLYHLQGWLAQRDGRFAATQPNAALQRLGAVGGIAVRVLVTQLGAVLQRLVSLVGNHVAGNQLHADNKGVIGGIVVAVNAGRTEAEARIHAVITQGAAAAGQAADRNHPAKIRAQRTAAGAGGDQLVTLTTIKIGIQAHARRDQIIHHQAAGGALGQGHDDVVQHAFANHQIAAGGVRGAGVAVVQATIGKELADLRRSHLLLGAVLQVCAGKVLATLGTGIIG